MRRYAATGPLMRATLSAEVWFLIANLTMASCNLAEQPVCDICEFG